MSNIWNERVLVCSNHIPPVLFENTRKLNYYCEARLIIITDLILKQVLLQPTLPDQMETNHFLAVCIIVVLTIGCQSTEAREVKPEKVEKHIWDKAELGCDATDIKSALWEKHDDHSAGVLFTGLRSVRSRDLDNIVISSNNYSIIIYPVRVVDEGVYSCSELGDVLAVYNLTARVVPQLRIQHIGFNVSHAICLDTVQDIHLVCIAFQSKPGMNLKWTTEHVTVQELSEFTNVSENEFMTGTYNFEQFIIVRPSVDFANITCIGNGHENLEYAVTVSITIDEPRGLLAFATFLAGFLTLMTIISLGVIYYSRLRRNRTKDHSKNVQSESCVYALPTKAKPSEEEERFSTREAKDHSKNVQSESFVYALPTKAKPSEEEERFSTREDVTILYLQGEPHQLIQKDPSSTVQCGGRTKDHSKNVQSESCVYALPTKAKPSEEEERFSTREAKDHSKNVQSESCVYALPTKAKPSEEEERFSTREDVTILYLQGEPHQLIQKDPSSTVQCGGRTKDHSKNVQSESCVYALPTKAKPSEEEERFSTREAKDHSKYVQSESCVYALPTKAKPSEEEETFSTREAKDHSKNMQSESCVCALTTKAKTSEEEETFSAREDKTDTIVRDEDDVGDVLINSYFGENKHQAPYDRKINTPYGRRNYGENQYQASTSYERKIKTPYFIKESHQEEEYSAIDDEMFDFKTIKDNQIRFITRLSKGHISDRWLVAFSAKLGTMKYVFICQAAKSKTDNQQHEWDVFAKEYNKIPASPHILKCLGSCYLNDQVYIVQTYTKMETLQDHVTLSAYELQKRLTDDMVALVKELLQFSLQTASGMAFILSQGFSHPSLSIANILLTDNKNCKLFDFCLRKDALCFLESIKTKSVDTSLYERSEFQGLVEYTTATDVWLTAYAIWQIFSQGALPIASGSDHDDVSDVFPKPELCPQILYIEMTRCWSEPRSNRPDIEELSSQLTKHAIGPHKTDDGLKQ
ncbi:uncharacterized protein [Apostichopus japonicus]|uniref:uncharacterized protein isoform X1 n=1 Tax=Stichopus japonicus TaxID=307972 RepID=UPI003AB1CB2E